MDITCSLQEVSANARHLVENRGCADQVYRMAGDVLDLAALLETWPVPRSLNLDQYLKRQIAELCRLSGAALCGTRGCIATDAEGCTTACSIS